MYDERLSGPSIAALGVCIYVDSWTGYSSHAPFMSRTKRTMWHCFEFFKEYHASYNQSSLSHLHVNYCFSFIRCH